MSEGGTDADVVCWFLRQRTHTRSSTVDFVCLSKAGAFTRGIIKMGVFVRAALVCALLLAYFYTRCLAESLTQALQSCFADPASCTSVYVLPFRESWFLHCYNYANRDAFDERQL